MLSVLLSFVLPLINISIFYGGATNSSNIILRSIKWVNYGEEIIISPKHNQGLSWENISYLFYFLISIFFIFKLINTFFWIKKLSKKYEYHHLDDIQFFNTKEDSAPFSFFKKIFWHQSIEPNSSNGLQMLRHEIVHVRQHHSADKLFMEITIILAWWNPIFHLIKKELSTIHEFIADQQAVHGDDNLHYASLLLNKAFGTDSPPLTNPFFNSQLKRRIIMLTNKKNSKFSYASRLIALPIIAIAVILFSFKLKEKIVNKNVNNSEQISTEDGDSTVQKKKYVPIDYPLPKYTPLGIIHTEESFMGSKIESIFPTENNQNFYVKTVDKKIYKLTLDEAAKELKCYITENKGLSGGKRDNNLQLSKNDNVEGSITGENITSSDAVNFGKAISSNSNPIYFLDGVSISKLEMDNVKPADIERIDVLKGEKAVQQYGDKAANGVILITTKHQNNSQTITQNTLSEDSSNHYDITFTKVDQPAEFPGGNQGWRRYLETNLRYPEQAQEKGIQGKVMVQMVVHEDGSITNVKTLNNPGGGLAEEAERVIKQGPKWIPAKQNGKIVTYRFVQNLTFQLSK